MDNLKDAITITKVFHEDCYSQSFDSLSSIFSNKIERRSYFYSGLIIVELLKSRDVINNKYQYLIGYFLLWELGRLKGDPNPFSSHLLYALEVKKEQNYSLPVLDAVGKTFISCLINQSVHIKELTKKSPIQVYSESIILNDIDVSSLVKSVEEMHRNLPPYVKSGAPCIIPFEDTTLFKPELTRVDESEQNSVEELIVMLEDIILSGANESHAPLYRDMHPEFIRPPPPLHCMGTVDELIWTTGDLLDSRQFIEIEESGGSGSGVGVGIIPDDIEADINEVSSSLGAGIAASFSIKTYSDENIIELLRAARTTSIIPAQLNQLRMVLKERPVLLDKFDLAPSEFPELVEKNPSLAIEVLLNIFEKSLELENKSEDVAHYLSELLKMDVSVKSLEVVNNLTTCVDLPPTFIRQYIHRCIESCYNSSDKQMYRLVRLVCVFLQSLIRGKTIDVKDMQNLNGFCIEFHNVKEANALFKLIKTVNSPTDNDS